MSKLILTPQNDYVVIDLETTGLSYNYEKIIELGAIKYKNNIEVARFNTLINPQMEISEFIEELTGITNEMVADKPTIETEISKFVDFIGDNLILGHYVRFDINFINKAYNDYFSKTIENDYTDTLSLSRRVLPDLKNHKLKTLKEYYDINTEAHRAIEDCLSTNSIYSKLKEKIKENPKSIEKLKLKTYDLTELKSKVDDIDENNYFFNQNICITGKLDNFTKTEAMQILVNLGAIPQNNVTLKTDVLITGNQAYQENLYGEKSRKFKKAMELKLKGQEISILDEQTFLSMLSENLQS